MRVMTIAFRTVIGKSVLSSLRWMRGVRKWSGRRVLVDKQSRYYTMMLRGESERGQPTLKSARKNQNKNYSPSTSQSALSLKRSKKRSKWV